MLWSCQTLQVRVHMATSHQTPQFSQVAIALRMREGTGHPTLRHQQPSGSRFQGVALPPSWSQTLPRKRECQQREQEKG